MENRTFKITVMAMCVGFNIIGGFLALTMKLPVYLDTMGTFLAAFLFGPIAGIATGVVSGVVNSITFDPISLYFTPVQIVAGFVGGILFKKGLFKGKLFLLGTMIVSIISAVIGAIIAAYVFGGITSSGSSIIVMYLKEVGVSLITSVFSTQIVTDMLDKIIVISLALYLIKVMPINLKVKYIENNKNNEVIDLEVK